MNILRAIGIASAMLLPSTAALAQAAAAHDHPKGAHAAPRLGTVTFLNSGARAANEPFLRGLALLHSFEYEDAADAFRAAQRIDRRFAMAYWGEALTYAKLLWGLDQPDSARAALARLAPTPAARLKRAGTPRERAYGAAVESLYVNADLPARLRAYQKALRALTAAYPDDLEARALLAVALQMGGANYSPGDAKERRNEAITLAQSIFEIRPNHPGGAHYLIHATDHPEFAFRGLAAARAYAKIAPDAEHAIHMPSHIFVQIGAWDDVVTSNERAWAASRAWVKARGVSPTEHSFHSLWWLQYGYLQQGRYAAARALIDTVKVVVHGIDWRTSDAIDARFALDEFRFTYASESGDWSIYEGKAPVRVAPRPGVPSGRARSHAFYDAYRAAYVSASLGDTAAAQAILPSLEGITPGALIARAHVAALIARARGDSSAHLARLREAAATDEAIVHFGPPSLAPAHEMLGDALLAAGLAREAIVAYEKGLELMRNRSASLLGLARAQRAAGDIDAAAKTTAVLKANWRAADAVALRR